MTRADDRIGALLCSWCDRPVDLCPCNPRPLPEPAPSSVVRQIQRGQHAERVPPASGAGVWPDALLGPITVLSPGYYTTGGAA